MQQKETVVALRVVIKFFFWNLFRTAKWDCLAPIGVASFSFLEEKRKDIADSGTIFIPKTIFCAPKMVK
jgi:hypothetical protein